MVHIVFQFVELMKKITRTFHLLLAFSLVLLPMRAVMADFSLMPAGTKMGTEMQIVDHYTGSQNHHDAPMVAGQSHEILMTEHVRVDGASTDCHDHNMTDCEACALHFTLKKDIEVSGLFLNPNRYIDYKVPVVNLVLPSKIRPPIS